MKEKAIDADKINFENEQQARYSFFSPFLPQLSVVYFHPFTFTANLFTYPLNLCQVLRALICFSTYLIELQRGHLFIKLNINMLERHFV